MKKTFLFLITLLVSLCFFVSCSDKVIDEKFVDVVNDAPYASDEELEELARSDENIVNYKVARTLGLIEMQNFLEPCAWPNTATLTETPVVIYSLNDTPEYYEFHVLDDDEVVGYVTCVADKRLGDPIQYISRDRKTYNLDGVTQRSSNQSKVKIYNNGYPNVSALPETEVKTRAITDDNVIT